MRQILITTGAVVVAAAFAGSLTLWLTSGPDAATAMPSAEPPTESAQPRDRSEEPPLPQAIPAPVEDVDPDVHIAASVTEADAVRDAIAFSRSNTKQNLRALLDDPNSAQFRGVGATQPEWAAPSVVFCGEINARNALGGYAPFRRFFGVGTSVYIDDSSGAFAKGFRENCDEAQFVAAIQDF